jgi:hypothetical protein
MHGQLVAVQATAGVAAMLFLHPAPVFLLPATNLTTSTTLPGAFALAQC